jgi:hypothetical protein
VSGENYIMRSFMICSLLLTKYYSGDEIKKNEMGGALACTGNRSGTYSILIEKPE